MKVKDLMERVVTLRPTATYEDVVRALFIYRLHGFPVVDEKHHLIGFVSEKDVFRVLYPLDAEYLSDPDAYLNLETREKDIGSVHDRKVDSFMQQKVVSINPDAHVLHAGALMLAHHIHQLPVVSSTREVMGMVTREQIFRALLMEHERLS